MNTSTVEAARQAIGPVGAFLPVTFTEAPSAHAQRDAVERFERAGYPCTWTNEVFGKDALVQVALLLGATRRMVFGTGVANVWVREPQTLSAAAAQLAQAHPGRFVLGIGVGYPQQAEAAGRDFGQPLATMREYQRRMGEATWPPVPVADYPRIVAANGPKMLELAAETADGALPVDCPSTTRRRPGRSLVRTSCSSSGCPSSSTPTVAVPERRPGPRSPRRSTVRPTPKPLLHSGTPPTPTTGWSTPSWVTAVPTPSRTWCVRTWRPAPTTSSR